MRAATHRGPAMAPSARARRSRVVKRTDVRPRARRERWIIRRDGTAWRLQQLEDGYGHYRISRKRQRAAFRQRQASARREWLAFHCDYLRTMGGGLL